MIEVNANLWEFPADVRVITTNGDVNRRGCAVMGRGVALQATQRYKDIEHELGYLLTTYGNKVFAVRPDLWTFPVKRHWKENASLALIRVSACQVQAMLDRAEDEEGRKLTVAMPRPGCGNGGLRWEDVRPLLVDTLKDSFVITHLAPMPVC